MFLKGFLLSLSAYFIWGLAPLFWKSAAHIPTEILLYHRVIVACFLLFILLLPRLKENFRAIRIHWPYFILTSILISLNWFIFVWAINTNRILETSLGYYLNPFLNLSLGYLLLNERLTKNQTLSVVGAFIGVCFITFSLGTIPWPSILLASTFSFYGYTHKKINMRADASLFTETLYLLPIFLFLNFKNPDVWQYYQSASNLLILFLAGLITIIPLLFFVQGVKHIPLGLTGILQFLAPSMTFCIAVFLYQEAFSFSQFLGFLFIWISIVFYILESFKKRRIQKAFTKNHQT